MTVALPQQAAEPIMAATATSLARDAGRSVGFMMASAFWNAKAALHI